jgi:NAD(P)-dependent dehydrogenase (short-subunit alcohol dehydrogenase family)
VNTDLTGRTVLITGANTGLGREVAERLADRGARLLLACRSESRARPVLEAITTRHGAGRASLVPLNLADLTSVRAAAAQVTGATDRVDLLINNAGVAGSRGLTKDGFELAFGVNHLGHFLLTVLLMPLLRAAGQARVVTVSSRAHYRPRGIDFQALRQRSRSFTGMPEYGVSKLCNVLFTKSLTAKLPPTSAGQGVTAVALHPGVVATEIWRRIPNPARFLAHKLFMITAPEGAERVLHAALAPDVIPGGYYNEFELRRPSRLADDPALAEALWQKSTEWCDVDLGRVS